MNKNKQIFIAERVRRLKIQRPANFWMGGLKAELHFGHLGRQKSWELEVPNFFV